MIFVNGKFLHAGRPNRDRPDVAGAFHEAALEKAGFSFMFPLKWAREKDNPNVRFFAVSKNGVASELHYPEEYKYKTPPALP